MNFEEDAKAVEPTASVEDISRVLQLRKGLVELIEKTSTELSILVQKLSHIDEDRLPTLFKEAKLEKIEWDNTTVTIKDDIRVGILKDGREAAWDWFEANGHGGAIKSVITAKFTDLDEARRVNAEIERYCCLEYIETSPTLVREIHHATLKKMVKEILDDPEQTLDEDIIPVHRFSKTTIKEKK